MMRLGPAAGDHLVVELPGQWQIGQQVAMHMPHLLAAVAVLNATKAVWHRLHPWPGAHSLPDQL